MAHDFWCLRHLDDARLLESTRHTLARGRELTAELVAHLSEVEERRLHLHAACSSMFDYCVNRLGLSEDEACRRIDVARLARRFPALYPLLANGSLSLGAVAALKPHITDDNHHELLQASRGLSLTKVREVLAARFPRADVPSTLRKVPQPKVSETPHAREHAAATLPLPTLTAASATPPLAAPVPEVAAQAPPPLTPPARTPLRAIEPLTPERYKLQLTVSRELKQKLEQCRDLMRHSNPSGDFAPVIERALELLLDQLMRERFGAAKRPRVEKPSSSARPSRATRRTVVARDGLRCAWVSDDGERCNATGWLEFDHEQALGKDGGSEASNVRVLCRSHNRLAAEVVYGRGVVKRAIEDRRRGPR
jgi:hypothetical protein